MRPSPLFTKSAVLSVFILLLTGFVAYRSGAFDKLLIGKKTNNLPDIEINTVMAYQLDTIPKVDTPPRLPTIMSSSKSLVMTDNYEYIFKDGELKQKLKKKNPYKTDSAIIKPPIMFSGSKSGPVITPRQVITPRFTPDTAKNKQ